MSKHDLFQEARVVQPSVSLAHQGWARSASYGSSLLGDNVGGADWVVKLNPIHMSPKKGRTLATLAEFHL